MKDNITLEVQALLNGYSLRYGFDPDNHIDQRNMKTLDEARVLYERGQKFSLLFGPPSDPAYHIEIFQTGPSGFQRIDVDFFDSMELANIFILEYKAAKFQHTKDEMLLVQASTNFGQGGKKFGGFKTHSVLSDGDLPWLWIKDEADYAVSVPWQDFYMGPLPTFDALIDGSFAARLPVITMPPKELLEQYIPSKNRKPSDPKRVPKGRFLNGDWVAP